MKCGTDFDHVLFFLIITRIHGIIESKWKWITRFITDLKKWITG